MLLAAACCIVEARKRDAFKSDMGHRDPMFFPIFQVYERAKRKHRRIYILMRKSVQTDVRTYFQLGLLGRRR